MATRFDLPKKDLCSRGKMSGLVDAKEVLILSGIRLGASLVEMSDLIGINPSTVSRPYDAAKRRMTSDDHMSEAVSNVIKEYEIHTNRRPGPILTMKIFFLVFLFTLISVIEIPGQIKTSTAPFPWTWVKPLVTKRSEIEKAFGKSITEDKSRPHQTYQADFGKINILYSKTREWLKEEGQMVEPDTVIDYFVSPRIRAEISQIPYDLSEFRKDDGFSPREIWYVNEGIGVIIVTEIVKIDGKAVERLRAFEQRPPRPFRKQP